MMISATSTSVSNTCLVSNATTTAISGGYYDCVPSTVSEITVSSVHAPVGVVTIEREKMDVNYHKEKTTVKANGKYSIPGVKRVHFNGRACVILWEDDDKTVALCGEGETFDRYTGFMAAVCKKLFGGTTPAKKLMDEKDAAYQAQLKAEKAAKEKAERREAAEKQAKKAHERRVRTQLKDLQIADEAYRRFKGEK